MARCFVGIMLPKGIRQSATQIQKKLVGFGLKCKFVEPENMHICLSFLGEVGEQKLEELKLKLDEVAKRYKKFDVNVDGMKFIPNENYIRVMVLDVTDRSGLLDKLRRDIANVVGGDSKPLHLTLCRVKYVGNKKGLVNEFRTISCNKGFQVGSVQLIESRLKRDGPVYTVVHESVLH
jgi:2'-5' RNA ligase